MHKTLPRQRNGNKSCESLGISVKSWKTPLTARSQLIYFRRTIYGCVDRLICNQEVGGSMPFVSTQLKGRIDLSSWRHFSWFPLRVEQTIENRGIPA
jgi:hypothetical protein